jgi:hypothetical protein
MAKPMSQTRFHAALDALDLKTYDQAAMVTGVGRRSLVRYGTGVLPVPKVLELLLEEWLAHGVPKHRLALWTPKGWKAPA